MFLILPFSLSPFLSFFLSFSLVSPHPPPPSFLRVFGRGRRVLASVEMGGVRMCVDDGGVAGGDCGDEIQNQNRHWDREGKCLSSLHHIRLSDLKTLIAIFSWFFVQTGNQQSSPRHEVLDGVSFGHDHASHLPHAVVSVFCSFSSRRTTMCRSRRSTDH